MKIINSLEINNIPWEEPPVNFEGPIWRYSKNPIIKRNPIKGVQRIFNSALVPYQGGFKGVFRGETNTGIPYLYLGESKDGIHFDFDEHPAIIKDELGNEVKSMYSYDPRLIQIEDKYYIVWCDEFHGPTISIAETKDFKTITKYNHPFLPFNRNGVLFPRKINNQFVMLSRPSDSGHTPFGDIFLSKSFDMKYWGDHKFLLERGYEWWCGTKIGAGCNPIETDEGWLLFIHGVANTCNGFVYSMGGVILDRDDPSIVKYRCEDFLLTPEMDYETTGFVPNVIFPTSALADPNTGRIAIYYGGADTVTSLAFTTIERVMDYIKKHSR